MADVSLPVRALAGDHDESDRGLLERLAVYERAVLGSSPKTIRNRLIYLRAYLRWWRRVHGTQDPVQATPSQVAAFLVAEAERGITARTRRAQLGALRRLYAWLMLEGIAPANPAQLVPSPKAAPPHTDTYSGEQINAILAHTASLVDLRGRQRHVIVTVLRHTGMRSQELRTLRQETLDLRNARATVVGKRDRQRVVLLPRPTLPVLRSFLADVRPLLPPSPLLLANAHPFVTTADSGFGMDALAREVELAGLGANVPGRHYPHKWRHTYATELLRQGVDVHVVQRLLGHGSISSTVGYLHLVPDDLREAAERVGELG